MRGGVLMRDIWPLPEASICTVGGWETNIVLYLFSRARA